jgi:RNA polymerase sporulation-specific sigma factor
MEASKGIFVMLGYVSNNIYYPEPLTPEEEKRLLKEYKNGSEEAKNILIERNIRLVRYIVNKKYGAVRNDCEDLISVGIIGLMKAICSFDSSRNIRLSTYAAKCIDNEILMYIRSTAKTKGDISLEEPIDVDKDGNEVFLGDVIGTDSDYVTSQVENNICTQMMYDKMENILGDDERAILKLRLGTHDGIEKTQSEIAKILGISRSYVSRLETKAVKKLNKALSM